MQSVKFKYLREHLWNKGGKEGTKNNLYDGSTLFTQTMHE